MIDTDKDNKKINSAIASFITMSKFLGVSVNLSDISELIQNANVKEAEILVLQCAKHYKLKAKLINIDLKRLIKADNKILPLIAKDNEGNFFIIIKLKEDNAIILRAEKAAPETITLDELSSIWDGTAILTAKKGGEAAEAMFSFKWFIPTILKYKREFILVLLAVFVVQILGILTPVMTQVVIDKVLSHNSMSTLYVITIGIAVVYIFELVLTLAKNYLFTHTTNRVDVMLSARLFNHLFSLPLKYFESRRTGETVARVRELDSIRQFLTGTPLSSMIDLVFIIVYIAVLFLYSARLTIIVLCSVPIYAVLSLSVTPLFKRRLDEKFNAGAETSSFLVESINGVQTIKSFALENRFESRWGDLQADYVVV